MRLFRNVTESELPASALSPSPNLRTDFTRDRPGDRGRMERLRIRLYMRVCAPG